MKNNTHYAAVTLSILSGALFFFIAMSVTPSHRMQVAEAGHGYGVAYRQ